MHFVPVDRSRLVESRLQPYDAVNPPTLRHILEDLNSQERRSKKNLTSREVIFHENSDIRAPCLPCHFEIL